MDKNIKFNKKFSNESLTKTLQNNMRISDENEHFDIVVVPDVVDEKKYCKVNKAFGLFWTLRPSPKMYFMVKIKKLTGSTNIIPKIERLFNRNQDKDLLPIFTDEQKKSKRNKTLYRCIQP